MSCSSSSSLNPQKRTVHPTDTEIGNDNPKKQRTPSSTDEKIETLATETLPSSSSSVCCCSCSDELIALKQTVALLMNTTVRIEIKTVTVDGLTYQLRTKFKPGLPVENRLYNGETVVYTGQINENGEPHGIGKWTNWDGSSYEGNWVSGHREGLGKATYGNYCDFGYEEGDVYEGNWVADKKEGLGRLIFADGDIYEGNWVSDEMNGQGKMIYGVGDVYEGNWVANKKSGHGKMIYENGDIYIGNWFAGERNGRGKLIFGNGDIYDGNWVSDKMEGKGKMIYGNGNIYKGNWVSDELNGHGKMIYSIGYTCKGTWRYDTLIFQGKMTTLTGPSYEGTFWKLADYRGKRIDFNSTYKGCFINHNWVGPYRLKNSEGSGTHLLAVHSSESETKHLPLGLLTPEELIQEFVYREGFADMTALKKAAIKTPIIAMPENPRDLADLLTYVDKFEINVTEKELIRSKLALMIDLINQNNHPSASPMILNIKLHLWEMLKVFDQSDSNLNLKRSVLINIGAGITPNTCLGGINAKVVKETRRLKNYIEDYQQTFLSAVEEYKTNLLTEIAFNLAQTNQLHVGNQVHYVNAAQVYLADDLGLVAETGKMDERYLDAEIYFSSYDLRRREFFRFIDLYKANTLLDSVYNTINEHLDDNGATCHLDGMAQCINDYLRSFTPFEKPSTLEELLDDNHVLAQAAKDYMALGLPKNDDLDYVYEQSLMEFVNNHYFVLQNDAPIQIKREGVNIILKILEFLA